MRKALDLCKTIVDRRQGEVSWWWHTQIGRCYIALGNPRSAEKYLRDSLQKCSHIDTALLLARVYVKIDQPLAAIDILENSLKNFPGEVSLMTHQARILELMDNLQTSVRMHRHIAQHEPINSEALACIAVHHFYGNQPEMSLLYYRQVFIILRANQILFTLNYIEMKEIDRNMVIFYVCPHVDHRVTTGESFRWAHTVVNYFVILGYAVCMEVNWIWFFHVSNVPYVWPQLRNNVLTSGTI